MMKKILVMPKVARDNKNLKKSAYMDRSRHPFSKSSHKDTPISVLSFEFLLGKLINSVDPQRNTSSHQGAEIVVAIYAGTHTT